MKSKILSVVLAAAVIGGVLVVNNSDSESLEAIQMSNAEALADGENDLCPNGCHDNGQGCYCYGWYPTYLEHDWNK